MFGVFAQSLFTATRISPLSNPEPYRDWRTKLRPKDQHAVVKLKDKATSSDQ